MIRRERQLQAARQQLALLQRRSGGPSAQAKVPKALLREGQTAELAAELEREIKEYEQLRLTVERTRHGIVRGTRRLAYFPLFSFLVLERRFAGME